MVTKGKMIVMAVQLKPPSFANVYNINTWTKIMSLLTLSQAPHCIFPQFCKQSCIRIDIFIWKCNKTLLRTANTEGAKVNKFLTRKYRNPHNTLACPYFIFFSFHFPPYFPAPGIISAFYLYIQ